MNKNQTVIAIVGMFVGLAAGAGIVQLQINNDHNQRADDRCWAVGGDYRDGKCEMPYNGMTREQGTKYPEGYVCMALGGNLLVMGEEKQCLSYKGDPIAMPSLEGKEVVIQGSTVILVDKK
jgi:hypothetical protein